MKKSEGIRLSFGKDFYRIELAYERKRVRFMDMLEKNVAADNIKISDVLENILVESGMSISAFARLVGYSRQYVYELLKPKGGDSGRKIQLDTLKRICDATGYPLDRFLIQCGYLTKSKSDPEPYTVVIVRKNGDRAEYPLGEASTALLEVLSKALSKGLSQ